MKTACKTRILTENISMTKKFFLAADTQLKIVVVSLVDYGRSVQEYESMVGLLSCGDGSDNDL